MNRKIQMYLLIIHEPVSVLKKISTLAFYHSVVIVIGAIFRRTVIFTNLLIER